MPEGQESKKSGFEVKGADGKTIVIPDGDFYFNTKARGRRMAQNSLSSDARRVYAVLELGTMAWQQEEAVVMDKGVKRPMTPDDIVQQSGLSRQNTRHGLEELEGAGLAERFSDDGGPLRKGHVRLRSWAVPRQPKEDVCSCAQLQIPDWWPKPDAKVPRWTDSWAPLRSLITRLRLQVSVDEESARDYKDEGDAVARAYKEAEIVAARFLERVCAPQNFRASNKEERTERTVRTTPPTNEPSEETTSERPIEAAPAVRPFVAAAPSNPSLKTQIKDWLVAHFRIPTAPTDDVIHELAQIVRDDAGFEQFKEAAQDAKPKSWRYFLPIARACANHRPKYEKAQPVEKLSAAERFAQEMVAEKERRKDWPKEARGGF